MELRHLRYFAAVAAASSISVAPRSSCTLRSRLSAGKSDSSRTVGAGLFDRSARPLRLTAAGQFFQGQALNSSSA